MQTEQYRFKYLLESEQDILWGLTITTAGFQHVEQGDVYPLHKYHPSQYIYNTEKGRMLDEYQLLYIIRGKGWFVSEHCPKTIIKEGNMFMLFPGEWHNFSSDKQTGWDEYCIGFRGVNIDSRLQHGFFSLNKAVFYPGINEYIVNLYKQAIVSAHEQKAGFQQMLAGIVNHLLGCAYSMEKQSIFESDLVNKINKAKIIMQENFIEGISPEIVANSVCMSYPHFRKIFKMYTGFAPIQYLIELRIQKSKELLANTLIPINEIALQTGFDNPDYFTLFFKNKTHYTPRDYRNFIQRKENKNE
jgi:AraC-like DNA-binding protein